MLILEILKSRTKTNRQLRISGNSIKSVNTHFLKLTVIHMLSDHANLGAQKSGQSRNWGKYDTARR